MPEITGKHDIGSLVVLLVVPPVSDTLSIPRCLYEIK
jgi:hypothetical protein